MRTSRHLAAVRLGAAVIAAATAPLSTPLPAHPQQRLFTPEIALDVQGVGIAAVTDDGSRIAATVRTRRDRTGVDHDRYGDPTYISPTRVRLMMIDTRSGERTWVHEEPAQLRGFAWSPDGARLAYFAVEDGAHRLRIYDAGTGRTEAVALRTDREIASSSPLVWSPGGAERAGGAPSRTGGPAEARAAFVALTEAPVIVQDSRNDFLAWDRVRNIAAKQITALVSLENGSVREILSRRDAIWIARVLGGRGVHHVLDGHPDEDLVHQAGRDGVRAVPAGARGGKRAGVAAGHRRAADERDLERGAGRLRVRRAGLRLRAAAGQRTRRWM